MCVEVFRKIQATLWRRPECAALRSEAEPGLAPGLPCPAQRHGRAGGRVWYRLFFSLIQRPPAIKTGSLDCPRCALVSCIQLCWFPECSYSLARFPWLKNVRRGWVRCLAPSLLQSFEVPAYEQSDSSVKKEAHSTFQVCFVLSHKDTGVLLSQPGFSRRVETIHLAGKIVTLLKSRVHPSFINCRLLSLSLSACLQVCVFIFIVSR